MQPQRYPYVLASFFLHAALAAATLIVWPALPARMVEATPVTVVASAPEPDVREAVQGDQQQVSQAPEQAPDPAPAPEPRPAPAPTPKPAPEKPASPAPVPKPLPLPKPTPLPAKPAPPKPDPLNLDMLAAARPAKPAPRDGLDLAALAGKAPRRPVAPQKGPSRPETDLAPRPALGQAKGLSSDALGALKAKLYRLWRPNCDVEAGRSVVLRVELKLGPGGRLAAPPRLLEKSSSGASDAVVEASSQRALSAVAQGEPYDEIPRDGPRDIVLRFNAKEACQGR